MRLSDSTARVSQRLSAGAAMGAAMGVAMDRVIRVPPVVTKRYGTDTLLTGRGTQHATDVANRVTGSPIRRQGMANPVGTMRA